MMISKLHAAIFDLDGVIVDTAKYHYLAWKRLAQEQGFDFSEADNERLKGVSRRQSLEILLEIGDVQISTAEKERMMAQKNDWYVDYIRQMDASEMLPGVAEYLEILRGKGVKTALGSASKNAPLILERLGITSLFDAVIDGNRVTHSKPNPEVFIKAAQALDVAPENCIVFEDAEAGIEAAHRAGMGVIGVGKPVNLQAADMIIAGLFQLVILNPGS